MKKKIDLKKELKYLYAPSAKKTCGKKSSSTLTFE